MAEADRKPRGQPPLFPAPGVVFVTAARTVSFATDRALELLACTANASQILLGPALAALPAVDDVPAEFPLDILRADPPGRRRLRVQAHPLKDGWLLLLEDADTLESRETVLAESIRAQMWKRLRPVLHHDFKAPIQSILWSLEILERLPNGGDEERRRETLEVIRKETGSLQARLSGLLDEIAPYDTESAIVDTGELVQHAAHLTRSECGLYGIDVEVAASERDLYVEGHRDDLKQALLSLLFIALDQLRDGGSMTLVAARAGASIELVVEGRSGAEEAGPTQKEIAAMPAFQVAAQIARSHGGDIAMPDRSSVCFVMTLPAFQQENSGA